MDGSALISIVCPAYQEEEVLPLFHAALVEAVEPLAAEYEIEIVYADDGSRDGTLKVMRELAATDPRVRYVSLSRNFGKEAALTAGVDHARGDAVVTLDTDLQHPPRLIPELVAKWREGYDVVATIRAEDRRLSWFKRTSSRLFYRVLGWCSTVDVKASTTDFRLMSRPAVDALRRLTESHRYTPGLVQWLGFRVASVPFTPDPRPAGETKFRFRGLLRLALDALLSFSPVPARAAALGGLAVTGLSWVASLVLCLLLLPLAEPVTRFAVIGLTAMHLLAGCLLVPVGVLGEYLYRVYEQAKGRPVYVLKECQAGPATPAVRLPADPTRTTRAA